MKFRFCGEADCPDWILAEINNLSRLSSIKLKSLTQIVAQGLIKPPIDLTKAEKLFSDSKLDPVLDIRSCVASLSYIISSTVRFNCNSTALHSELQQLGLPREHSTSIKRVIDEQNEEIGTHFRSQSLKINPLTDVKAGFDRKLNCLNLNLNINEKSELITLTPYTAKVLLSNILSVRETIVALNENPLTII